MSKNRPGQGVQTRALRDRASVLQVIVCRPGLFFTGSAFVVKRDNQCSILLSCEHIVTELNLGNRVWVRRMVPEGGIQQLRATIMHKDDMLDVCLLKVPGLTTVAPLQFAPSSHAGQDAITIGYVDPQDLFNEETFSRMPALSPGHVGPDGTVRKATRAGRPLFHVKLDCVVGKGMSGGPVITSSGVIGMNDSATYGLAIAVAPESIRQSLKIYLNRRPEDNSTLVELIDLIK